MSGGAAHSASPAFQGPACPLFFGAVVSRLERRYSAIMAETRVHSPSLVKTRIGLAISKAGTPVCPIVCGCKTLRLRFLEGSSMNGRTAKLLNKVAARLAVGANLKRLWYATPWRKRNALRKHLERAASAAPEDVQKVFPT